MKGEVIERVSKNKNIPTGEVEILVKKLKAKIILIGYDHKFGKNRTANINDLKKIDN